MTPYEAMSSAEAASSIVAVALGVRPGWPLDRSGVLALAAPLDPAPLQNVQVTVAPGGARMANLTAFVILKPRAGQVNPVAVNGLALDRDGELVGYVSWNTPFYVEPYGEGLYVPLDVLGIDGGP